MKYPFDEESRRESEKNGSGEIFFHFIHLCGEVGGDSPLSRHTRELRQAPLLIEVFHKTSDSESSLGRMFGEKEKHTDLMHEK